MYARGMTVRAIQSHLRELYAVDVLPDLISRVTDAVLDEVREWQNRPLDAVYSAKLTSSRRLQRELCYAATTRPNTPSKQLRRTGSRY